MPQQHRLSPPALISRWLVGMGLVSWRYLWATTPLHRTETHESTPKTPPPLPAGFPTGDMQGWELGVGPMFHRLFRVRIGGADKDAAGLMDAVLEDMDRFVPSEVVSVHRGDASDRRLQAGDDIVVDMPGPWNGPVRVVAAEPTRLHLATLVGHLEAGQIEFRGYDDDPHIVFEVEAWARPASRSVRMLYELLRLAKEIQLNMWVRFCLAAAREAAGKPVGGIEIRTTVTPVPSGGAAH
jgi:hypothetical protein